LTLGTIYLPAWQNQQAGRWHHLHNLYQYDPVLNNANRTLYLEERKEENAHFTHRYRRWHVLLSDVAGRLV